MKNIYYLFLAALLLVIAFSCYNNPINADEDVQGRRDYVWEIDTISSGSNQTYLTSIWGSSYNNVWISGFDANNPTGVYHFNGDNWNLALDIPPTPFMKNYSALFGIDSNYFVLAGSATFFNNNPPPNFLDSGLVVEFENGNWNVEYLSNAYGLNALCVLSKNVFWVGDRNGSLLHYKNNNWQKFTIDSNLYFYGLVALNSADIYAVAHVEDLSGTNYRISDYLLHYQGSEWQYIDSNITSNNYNRHSFPTLIKNINGKLYGSAETGIVKKDGNTWKIIGDGFYGQINGTDENNIFLGNQNFGVMHYNGNDWYRFDDFPYLRYSGIAVFYDSVFLLASDGNKSFVVRGKRI